MMNEKHEGSLNTMLKIRHARNILYGSKDPSIRTIAL